MTAIWSSENRYRIWWAIEVFAAEAMGNTGMIPAEDAATIRKAYDADALGEIDVPAIDAIEAVTKHDVIAFLTWAGEKLGPERRWLHQGMTSSDVLDTSLAVQLKQSADLLLDDLDQLLEVLKRAPSSTSGRRPLAEATGSTPSRPPSASSSPRPMPSSTAAARAWWRRAPRWRPARSRARSAPSPTSRHRSRSMSPPRSA